MREIKDFLNPKSMLTPGLAGGVTMMIANALWLQFSLPQKWTGLVISFLFGLLVFITENIPYWQRSIYYILNSLVIFSIGVGSSALGASLEQKPFSPNKHVTIEEHQPIKPTQEKYEASKRIIEEWQREASSPNAKHLADPRLSLVGPKDSRDINRQLRKHTYQDETLKLKNQLLEDKIRKYDAALKQLEILEGTKIENNLVMETRGQTKKSERRFFQNWFNE